jgi:hypothetical protein
VSLARLSRLLDLDGEAEGTSRLVLVLAGHQLDLEIVFISVDVGSHLNRRITDLGLGKNAIVNDPAERRI